MKLTYKKYEELQYTRKSPRLTSLLAFDTGNELEYSTSQLAATIPLNILHVFKDT